MAFACAPKESPFQGGSFCTCDGKRVEYGTNKAKYAMFRLDEMYNMAYNTIC